MKMKIRYISGLQSLDIKPEGLSRSKGVEFAVGKKNVVYADDMLLSIVPFCGQGALLMCPSNAQEEVKKLVRESGGFVSQKRSTEAVAEFLAEVYPSEYRDRHHLIHSIYFDKDGVLWEEERVNHNLPFFSKITDYVRNCQGPYTAHPPISIATGAAKKSVERVADYIGLNKANIPVGMQWPPIVFEEGCLVLNPVSGKTLDLTEEKYGLFSSEFRELALFIKELGQKINQRVSMIDEQLGYYCKAVCKEKSGYTLDLPLEMRGSREELRMAHSVIYRNIRDLLPEDIEFVGLFTRQELES